MSVGVLVKTKDFDRLQRALRRFKYPDQDLMEAIGATLESQTRRRIQEEKASPEGEPWQEWSEEYVSRPHGSKEHASTVPHSTKSPAGGHSYLQLFGHLLDSILYEATSEDVTWGSNVEYAAVHQLGYKAIPPRPYLGLSRDNEEEIAEIIESWFEEQMPGPGGAG